MEPDKPVPDVFSVNVFKFDPRETPEMVELLKALFGMEVNNDPDPLNVVAVTTPVTTKPLLNVAAPVELMVVPVPRTILLLEPSRVIELVPIVRMPVILASPITINCVVPPPTIVFPSVEIPET